MEEKLLASTQYGGDLRGEVFCEGFGGPFIGELWKELGLPSGYFPLAMSFEVVNRQESEPFFEKLRIKIYACNTGEYGKSLDEINKSAVGRGKVVVEEFEVEKAVLEKVLEKIKRLSIVVRNNHLDERINIHVPED